jgi:hypothetical protein
MKHIEQRLQLIEQRHLFLPKLKKPVRMQTGVKINVFAQLVGDAVQYASLAVYCASGKYEIFQGLAHTTV